MNNKGELRRSITDLNPHIVCVLCSGYFIDPCTLVECLHSFCKTCIVKHLEGSVTKACPICDTVIHKTKPFSNMRIDKTLQDIVFKIVPGLHKNEVERRKNFYMTHPVKETDIVEKEFKNKMFFSHTDKFSLSIEYFDNQPPEKKQVVGENPNKRYLECPGTMQVCHLKKFIAKKYDLNGSFIIDVIYQDDLIPNNYTIIDIAYSYNWRKDHPMQFYYRIFKKNKVLLKRKRKSSQVEDNKSDAEIQVIPNKKPKDSPNNNNNNKSIIINNESSKASSDKPDSKSVKNNVTEVVELSVNVTASDVKRVVTQAKEKKIKLENKEEKIAKKTEKLPIQQPIQQPPQKQQILSSSDKVSKVPSSTVRSAPGKDNLFTSITAPKPVKQITPKPSKPEFDLKKTTSVALAMTSQKLPSSTTIATKPSPDDNQKPVPKVIINNKTNTTTLSESTPSTNSPLNSTTKTSNSLEQKIAMRNFKPHSSQNILSAIVKNLAAKKQQDVPSPPQSPSENGKKNGNKEDLHLTKSIPAGTTVTVKTVDKKTPVKSSLTTTTTASNTPPMKPVTTTPSSSPIHKNGDLKGIKTPPTSAPSAKKPCTIPLTSLAAFNTAAAAAADKQKLENNINSNYAALAAAQQAAATAQFFQNRLIASAAAGLHNPYDLLNPNFIHKSAMNNLNNMNNLLKLPHLGGNNSTSSPQIPNTNRLQLKMQPTTTSTPPSTTSSAFSAMATSAANDAVKKTSEIKSFYGSSTTKKFATLPKTLNQGIRSIPNPSLLTNKGNTNGFHQLGMNNKK